MAHTETSETTETMLAADLVRLQVHQHGPDWLPPIVLVHPWMSAAAAWGSQLNALAHSSQVVTFDLRGHGRSDKPARGYRLTDYTDDLNRVITCYGDGQSVALVGWSMGATVALYYAAHRPDRVAKLAAISASPCWCATAEWPHGMPPQDLERLLHGLANNYGKTAAGFLNRYFGPLHTRWHCQARLLCQVLADLSTGTAIAAAGTEPASLDLRPLLPHITCPVLVLHGDQDLLTPPPAAHYLADHLPNATFTEISGGGHWMPMTHPQQINTQLLDFLH